MRKTGVLFLILFLLSPISVLAAEVTALERELAVLKTESVDQVAESLDAETDFSEILREVVTGDFDLSFSGWKEKLTEMAFGEFQLQGKLLMQLVIVVLLSAILKQLSDSFQGKSVGEMGFYLCYMVLVVVILGAFHSISDVVVERMSGINGVFAAMLPVFLVLSAANGDPTQGVLMGPAIMGGSAALSVAISQIIVPTILLAISLEMADHISEKPILGKFAELLRQCIGWGMKGAAMIFMLLLSLQKIGGSALHGLAAKTAKIAVNSVPVVGNTLGGAVETAAAVVGTLRSGTLVAAAVFLLALCIPLLIKLTVIMLVFKLTAAAAEFICEERLVECISAAGEYTGLLLGVVFLGEGMFLFSALLLLGGL
ncbi:MAG: stage III sporulation protein AE [Anaerotignum sp.]|nr:stage III sporulation protein AE [Anaerotignum sp.]